MTAANAIAVNPQSCLVARMLANHADPNHANDFGATALHWAIDDAAKTRLLLDAGARANAEDRTGTRRSSSRPARWQFRRGGAASPFFFFCFVCFSPLSWVTKKKVIACSQLSIFSSQTFFFFLFCVYFVSYI